MKTPEVIKNSLRICSTWETNCEECPYKNMKKAISCSAEMKRDSLTYIEQLEKRTCLNTMRDAIYEDAVAHGLWEEKDGPYRCADIIAKEARKLIKEADHLSIYIHGSIDYTSPCSNYAEQLADVIIASLSVAGKLGIDIDAAVRSKMEINKARPWKHGKDEQGNTWNLHTIAQRCTRFAQQSYGKIIISGSA